MPSGHLYVLFGKNVYSAPLPIFKSGCFVFVELYEFLCILRLHLSLDIQKGNTGVPLPHVILCTRSHRQKGWAAFAKQGSCQPSSKAKPKTSLCFLPRTALPCTIRYLLPTSGASVFLEWSPPPVMTNDPNADVCPLSSQRPHPSPGGSLLIGQPA